MVHIAAIVHGNEFMVLLPHANLYDLEIFLRGGYDPNPSTEEKREVYDFKKLFPELNTDIKMQQAVVEEAHQVASALKWLHEDLRISDTPDCYLAHMDLKPANILLVSDSRCPAGRWMLSDFGVSAFYKATNARVLGTPAIRDVGNKLTSRGFQDKIVRGYGPYQAPEVNAETVDSRKCDVWSFCCVLCDILAFAVGRTKALIGLRNSRYGAGDDFFYETMSPTNSEFDDTNTKLKQQIVDWWDTLESRSSARWVSDYIKVLREALKPRPSDRPGIGNIASGLGRLVPSITSQANMPQTNSLIVPNNPEVQGRRPSITILEPTISRDILTDPQNTAPSSVDQDQPLSAFPWPHTALLPERDPQAQPERDDSQSSSGSPGSQRRARTSPAHESPERQNVPLGPMIGKELAKRSISLPKKCNVKAIAIAPSALQLAVLCQYSVHLYSTNDEEETCQPINLSQKVNWKKVKLASEYLAVYGLGPSNKKHVSHKTPSRVFLLIPIFAKLISKDRDFRLGNNVLGGDRHDK